MVHAEDAQFHLSTQCAQLNKRKTEGSPGARPATGILTSRGAFAGSARSATGNLLYLSCQARQEPGVPNMSWLHAHFSEQLAFPAIFGFDPTQDDTELRLRHGRVLENGQLNALKEGKRKLVRKQERHAGTGDLEATDATAWRMAGRGQTAFARQRWANRVSFNARAHRACDGLIGHVEVQDFLEVPQLTLPKSDMTTRLPSRRES